MNEIAQVEKTNVAEVEPVGQAAAMMEVISRAATDPNVDVDKMERLFALQSQMMDREAARAFADAMSSAQAEIEPVARDKRNNQTGSDYAKLESIAKSIQPIIAKHGFSLSFGTDDCPREGFHRVTCDVMHRDGHTVRRHADLPADSAGIKGQVNKTPMHAFGSTMTYGRRYLTLLIFNISTADDDGNAAGDGPTITVDQFQSLREKIETAGADEAKMCTHFKIGELHELPQMKYGQADALLDAKIAKAQADA